MTLPDSKDYTFSETCLQRERCPSADREGPSGRGWRPCPAAARPGSLELPRSPRRFPAAGRTPGLKAALRSSYQH